MRIFTCIHGRRELTRAFFWHLDYLRERTKLDLPISLCYSNDEDFEAIEEFIREQDSAVKYPNTFLGDKWNYLTSNMIKTHKDDYYLCVGSDDFLSVAYIELINALKVDFAGTNELYFYQMFTGKAISFKYNHPVCKTLGAGRLYSHRLLEKFNGTLWDKKQQSSLDNYSEKLLFRAGYVPTMVNFKEPQIVDVKSYENIHNFEEFETQGEKVEGEKVLSLMPNISFE